MWALQPPHKFEKFFVTRFTLAQVVGFAQNLIGQVSKNLPIFRASLPSAYKITKCFTQVRRRCLHYTKRRLKA